MTLIQDSPNLHMVLPDDGTYQVTEWGHPDEPVVTPRGRICYLRCLELESLRWMESNLRDSWIRQDLEGLVALFSWKKYMKEVLPEDDDELLNPPTHE